MLKVLVCGAERERKEQERMHRARETEHLTPSTYLLATILRIRCSACPASIGYCVRGRYVNSKKAPKAWTTFRSESATRATTATTFLPLDNSHLDLDQPTRAWMAVTTCICKRHDADGQHRLMKTQPLREDCTSSPACGSLTQRSWSSASS
jgi:hypothetical protein